MKLLTSLFNRFYIVILTLLLVSAGACEMIDSSGAQPIDWEDGETIVPPDDGQLSEEQRAQYREDAEKLAVGHVNEQQPDETEIPEALVALYYNGLVHIALSDLPEAQEATQEFEIHPRKPADPREITVYADTTADWIDAWRTGNTETGYEDLDELIGRFTMTLTEYRELEHASPNAVATLRADRAVNVYAVGRLFEELDDIESAGTDPFTDGSDLSVELFEDHLRYTYDYGFGDCPAGCINRHQWQFEVYKDGSVVFAGEEGDDITGGS